MSDERMRNGEDMPPLTMEELEAQMEVARARASDAYGIAYATHCLMKGMFLQLDHAQALDGRNVLKVLRNRFESADPAVVEPLAKRAVLEMVQDLELALAEPGYGAGH